MTSNHEGASLKLANSLPSYLYEGNRLSELIEYLSDNYFTDALMASQSISFIRKMAALGFDTAKELNDELSIIRFSFYTTLIAELTIAETWRSEVEALMELDDYEGALSLAHSAKLKEDRLHLLAVIARKKREQDDIPEPELLEEMRNLHQQIDYSGLSDERSSEIAIDVLYSSPDTAIEIIERSQDVGEEYDALDWVLARLSFEAIRSQDDDNASENIRSRIKNPSVKRLSDEISLMLKNYTGDEVIEEIEKLDQVTDKLYLLRHWTVTNRMDEKVAEVIEYAFNLTLQSTAYTPNARLFRELASPLPNIADTSKLQNLIAKFDGQKAFCEQYGPTEDHVRLHLIIARAELKLDEVSAENRILEVYYFISDLQDYLVKSECMSRLLAALILIDRPDLFDQKHGLYTVATDDLKQYFEKLMDSTADQYAASKRIIQALAKRLPDLAVEFSNSLNTSDRRNEALQGVFNALLDTPDDLLNFQALEDVLAKIADQDLQDDCIVSGLQRLARVELVDFNIYIAAKNIMNAAPDLKDAGQRCQALCYILQFHGTQGQDIDKILSFDIFSLLSNSYHSIDVLWHKVDTGFQIAQSVAKYSVELGQEYLSSSQRYKRESSLCNSTLANAYIGCIRLGITAFSGMLSNEIMSDEDLEYLGNLINRLPSSGERAELWSDLAIHHFLNHSTDKAKDIVDQQIRPLIANISEDDGFYCDEVTCRVSPALYLANRTIALDLISKLSLYHQHKAITIICQFYLRKRPLSEPYDAGGITAPIKYDDALEICEILPKMGDDGGIYHHLSQVCDAIEKNINGLNRNQKADLISKLENIATTSFPTANGIQHEGYEISCLAHIYRIKRGVSKADWTDLADRARNLPNSADQAFVLSVIAESMPMRMKDDSINLFKEAEQITEKIPSTIDRAEHYEALSARSAVKDSAFAKRMWQLAMKASVVSDDPEMDSVQRRLVDLAYRLDPDLASSISSITDDDTARLRAKMITEEHVKIRQSRELISKGDDQDIDKRLYSKTCSMYLAALNAGKLSTLSPETSNRLLNIVPQLPLRRAYSILALITQNYVVRYAKDTQSTRFIQPYFDVSMLSAQLVENVSDRVLRDLEQDSSQILHTDTTDSLLVEPGQREKGIQFIQDWLRNSIQDYLLICDGYFGLDDLEVLKLLNSVCPDCQIIVLTSKGHLESKNISKPWSDSFREYWRLKISEAHPPNTTFVVAGIQSSNNLPIHDRWWLTKNSGLRLGTSLNGLGNRSSEISIMDSVEAERRENEVRQYTGMSKRTHNGDRILYELFTL